MVTEKVPGCRVPGERLDDLLRRPRSRKLLRYIEMGDTATMVREHDEDEEDPEGYGGYSKEINGHEVPAVIGKEDTPRLWGRLKELFMRWTELGAFTPTMRAHEGEHKDDNCSWEKDTETTDHFRRFARVDDVLAPEFQALAVEAASTSAPIFRQLMLVFADDPASRSISDQFLVGDSLPVVPVVEEGATRWSVYLPPGSTWHHVWTGTPYTGGQTVLVSAPATDCLSTPISTTRQSL